MGRIQLAAEALLAVAWDQETQTCMAENATTRQCPECGGPLVDNPYPFCEACHKYFSLPEDETVGAPSPSSSEIVAEFKRRRTRRLAAVPALLALIPLFMLMFGGPDFAFDVFGIPAIVIGPVCGAVVLAGLIFAAMNWRCPACRISFRSYGTRPKFCPKCGVRQQEQKLRTSQRIAGVLAVLIAVLFVVLNGARPSGVFGIPAGAIGAVFVAVLYVLIFIFMNWRCPACEGSLRAPGSLKFCPNCGVKLQE